VTELPDLYSRRLRAQNPSGVDIYSYDEIPARVRVQIIHIVTAALGPYHDDSGYDTAATVCYDHILKIMREELGVFSLTRRSTADASGELFSWLQTSDSIEHQLDLIELLFGVIDRVVRENEYTFSQITTKTPDDAIGQLNKRLREAGVGYHFNGGKVFRIDSEYLHTEVVISAIHLTNNAEFRNANLEYMRAHEHFIKQDYESCVVECAKAFESTLKIIGAAKSWPITQNDNASKLIGAAVSSGFLSCYLEAGFTSLRSMLESGVPVPRNKDAGHGAGKKTRHIPAALAAFQLHQSAAAIIFLINTYKAQ
jgi:hypothetical protein